jgi:hypothetical protein
VSIRLLGFGPYIDELFITVKNPSGKCFQTISCCSCVFIFLEDDINFSKQKLTVSGFDQKLLLGQEPSCFPLIDRSR